MVAVGACRGSRVGGRSGARRRVRGGGHVTYLEQLTMWLEHAREDYQHARTFCSATGVTYTPVAVERHRLRVVELEAAVERARESSGR